MRKFLSALIVLTAASFTVGAQSIGEMENQKAQYEREAEDSRLRSEWLEGKINSISELKRKLDEEAEAATADYDTKQAALNDTLNRIEENELKLIENERDYEKKRNQLERRVRDIYINGQISYIDVIFGAQDFGDFLTRMDLLKHILVNDSELVTSALEYKTELDAIKLQLAQDKEIQADQARFAAKAKENKLAKVAEQQALLDRMNNDKAVYDQRYDEMMAASKEITKMIEESKLKAAAEAAAREQEARERAIRAERERVAREQRLAQEQAFREQKLAREQAARDQQLAQQQYYREQQAAQQQEYRERQLAQQQYYYEQQLNRQQEYQEQQLARQRELQDRQLAQRQQQFEYRQQQDNQRREDQLQRENQRRADLEQRRNQRLEQQREFQDRQLAQRQQQFEYQQQQDALRREDQLKRENQRRADLEQRELQQRQAREEREAYLRELQEQRKANTGGYTRRYNDYEDIPETTPEGNGEMLWPVIGPVTSEYGWRTHPIFGDSKFHSGIDIAADYGVPINAARGGVVTHSGWIDGYGNTVMIDHGGGIVTLYGHNQSLAVNVGQTVSQGQVIAYCGSTGNSTGPHCHFEVRLNGEPVSPYDYL